MFSGTCLVQARVQQDHETPLPEIVRQLLHHLQIARPLRVVQARMYGRVSGWGEGGGRGRVRGDCETKDATHIIRGKADVKSLTYTPCTPNINTYTRYRVSVCARTLTAARSRNHIAHAERKTPHRVNARAHDGTNESGRTT